MYYIHVFTADSIKSIDSELLEKEFTRLAELREKFYAENNPEYAVRTCSSIRQFLRTLDILQIKYEVSETLAVGESDVKDAPIYGKSIKIL